MEMQARSCCRRAWHMGSGHQPALARPGPACAKNSHRSTAGKRLVEACSQREDTQPRSSPVTDPDSSSAGEGARHQHVPAPAAPPAHTTTATAPQQQRHDSSPSSSNNSQQSEGSGASPSSPTPSPGSASQPSALSSQSAPTDPSPDPAADVDRQLSAVWEDIKRQMKAEMDPESARVLDGISFEELTSGNAMGFFRKLADAQLGPILMSLTDAQLGPILMSLGLNVDPFDFFIDVVKLASFLQFVTCGMLWYGTTGLAHLEPSQAFTATTGLALGYLTRPAFKIEQLLFPVYNALLQLFVPNATYMVAPSTRTEVQGTLNKLGISLALLFLVPQLLLGWDSGHSTALVLPWCAGWFLFDLTYMAAMLLRLRQHEQQ